MECGRHGAEAHQGVGVGQTWDTAQLIHLQLQSVWGRSIAFVLICCLRLLHSKGSGAR